MKHCHVFRKHNVTTKICFSFIRCITKKRKIEKRERNGQPHCNDESEYDGNIYTNETYTFVLQIKRKKRNKKTILYLVTFVTLTGSFVRLRIRRTKKHTQYSMNTSYLRCVKTTCFLNSNSLMLHTTNTCNQFRSNQPFSIDL